MCLIFVAHRVHPRFSLLLAANRDEYYDRETAPAGFWADAPAVLAGRDLRAGGTWLGVDRSGRVAALTNFRHGLDHRPDAPSRGHLVSDYLTGAAGPRDYLDRVAESGARYNGFSLLAGDRDGLWFYSNRDGAVCEVPPGIHGLSNELLDTPWPKVARGRERLATLVAGPEVAPEDLLEMMADRAEADDDRLPDTGVARDRERRLSAMFIHGDGYGTRSTTVLRVDGTGRTDLVERTYDAAGTATGTVRHGFTVMRPAARAAAGT